MKTPFRRSFPAAALAALAASSTAAAQEPELDDLIHPQSRVELGIGAINHDARRFGMYNGIRESGVYPIVDGTIYQRNDETGTWIRVFGKTYGTEGGQLRFEHEKQGDWNYYVEGGRTTYTNPREISTTLTGLGTTVNLRPGAARKEVDLQMHRDSAKFGAGKSLPDGFDVDFSARVERKTGLRQWGAQGFNFAVEPIEFTTQEYKASLSYTGEQLQLEAGYLASLFANDPEVLESVSTSEPRLSLPPDNMVHQLYLSGGYSFTPSTRGTLYASYGRTFQNETFFTPPTFPGNTRSDLGGEVDNALINLGLSSRPLEDLSTRLKLRYEERNDNTPLAQYVPSSSSRMGFNVPFSRATVTGDAEADYQLPMDFTLTGGVGYEHWDRSSPPRRQTAWRKTTEEVSGRLNLRRPLLETLSGSLGYVHAERHGSAHQPDGTDLIDPILWANRRRDKGRATLDWVPSDELSFQFVGEIADDSYRDRQFGPRNGYYYFLSLDANYQFADDWDLTGWVAWNRTEIEQRTMNSAGTRWEAQLELVGTAAGLSLGGPITDDIKLIADLQWSRDISRFGIGSLGGTAGMGPSLPHIIYRQFLATLTGDYAIEEDYGIKLKYGFADLRTQDWTWESFVYADGTRVSFPQHEQVHFVGLSAYYRW